MGILINDSQIGGGTTSNSFHNIGEIFYTMRTDTILNGAVECDGSQYNFTDFPDIKNLLENNQLPYLSIGEFDSQVESTGICGKFGYGTNELTLYPVEIYLGHSAGVQYYSNVYDWTTIEPDPKENYILPGVKIYDKNTHEELVGYTVKQIPEVGDDMWQIYNADNEFLENFASPSYWPGGEITVPTGGEFQSTTYFKVPKLSNIFIESGTNTNIGNYIEAGLPNITGDIGFTGSSLKITGSAFTDDIKSTNFPATSTSNAPQGAKPTLDASRCSSIYGKSTTVQPPAVLYRTMIQLKN